MYEILVSAICVVLDVSGVLDNDAVDIGCNCTEFGTTGKNFNESAEFSMKIDWDCMFIR